MEAALQDMLLQCGVTDAINRNDWLEAISYLEHFENQMLAGIALCVIYEAMTGECVKNLLMAGANVLEQIRTRINLN